MRGRVGTTIAVTALAAVATGLVGAPIVSAAPTRPTAASVAVSGFDDLVRPVGRVPIGAPFRLDVPVGTTSVGLTWAGGPMDISLRSRGPSGWSDWVTLGAEVDHGESTAATVDPVQTQDARLAAGPVWIGRGTDAVELFVPAATGAPLEALTLHTDSEQRTAAGSPVDLLSPPTRAIHPSSAWSSPGWSRANCPEGPTTTRPVDAVIVHHTATTTDYQPDDVDDILRSVHRFHTRTRGWCDVAYQFFVDRFGRIWEGRTGGIALPIRGGHARGFNTASVGIAIVGNFDHHALPAETADAVALLAGWKAAANDFDPAGRVRRTSGGSTSIPAGEIVEIPTVSGHRDVSSTSCPGGHAHRTLSSIRERAGEMLAAPAPFTFGGLRDTPLVGDWNGDGSVGVGTFSHGVFRLRNSLSGGSADVVIRFGLPGDVPVVGDWNGDGVDTVGVERDGSLHLLNANHDPDTLGLVTGDRSVHPAFPQDFARHGATPLVGDWDGDGVDTVGFASGGDVVLFGDPAAQVVSRRSQLGGATDHAISIDFESDGVDGVALVRNGLVHAPSPFDAAELTATHQLAPGEHAFVIDWSSRGLPTLLTVGADGQWDPTTPIGR